MGGLGQVREKSKGGCKDALSCLRAVEGTRYHLVPSSSPFPGLTSFSLQSTYLMIVERIDKGGHVLVKMENIWKPEYVVLEELSNSLPLF